MRQSRDSLIVGRATLLRLLGVVLGIAVIGATTWRLNAKDDVVEKRRTHATGLSTPDPKLSGSFTDRSGLVPESGGLLYIVNSTGDGGLSGPPTQCDDGTGRCTLRAAIQAANLHAGNDGISFSIPPTDSNCVGPVCTINLTQQLPILNDGVSIAGPGANLLTVRRNSGGNYRIFTVSQGNVTLSGMTISSGAVDLGNTGGGIYNASTLNVNNCAISGNFASQGGGIFNASSGIISVTGSTLFANSTAAVADACCLLTSGGGIENYGTFHLTNSTVYANSSFGVYFLFQPFPGYGGGIHNGADAVMSISNSTIVGNFSDGSGPTPGYGGGIYDLGTITVKNSIIANNSVNIFGNGPDVSGSMTSEGFNLIGRVNGGSGFNAPADLIGTIASPLDPKLDPAGLRNNGGPTPTIALLCGSRAIDKGSSVGLTGNLTTDQRGVGFPRKLDDPSNLNANGGDGTDVGAFEGQHFCRSRADFDGDLRSDLSVFRTGTWYLQRSSTGFFGLAFGIGTDAITPGDYDGDGKADIAVFRTDTWYLLRSSDGFVTSAQFGTSGDLPRAADYDGDGYTDLAVYRPSTNTYYVRRSSDLALVVQNWGIAGDVPLTADFDGDNRSDYGVFRNGTWHVMRSSAGYVATQFGSAGDRPVPADYDGDYKADFAVFRNGTWYLLRSTAGFAGIQWGIGTDMVTPGDYDGDGKDDIAIFRGSTGTWHIQASTSGYVATQFGSNGDVAVPTGYIP